MSHDPSSTGPKAGLAPLPPWLIIAIFMVVIGLTWWQTGNSPSLSPAKSRDAVPSASGETDTRQSHDSIPVEVAGETESENGSAEAIKPSASNREPHNPGSTSKHDVHAKREDDKSHAVAHDLRIEDQVIRNLNGQIVFQGTVDLQPTLDRIRRGDQNSHRNDGTTFQNRERRLPAKPAGYYKEYVHSTHGISGPGPQRVIVGKDGDAWYTPDHYQTFRRLPSRVE